MVASVSFRAPQTLTIIPFNILFWKPFIFEIFSQLRKRYASFRIKTNFSIFLVWKYFASNHSTSQSIAYEITMAENNEKHDDGRQRKRVTPAGGMSRGIIRTSAISILSINTAMNYIKWNFTQNINDKFFKNWFHLAYFFYKHNLRLGLDQAFILCIVALENVQDNTQLFLVSRIYLIWLPLKFKYILIFL